MQLPNLLEKLVLSSCLLCHGTVRGPKPLCAACEHELPRNQPACLHCALPLPGEHFTCDSPVCGECLQCPPVFHLACCAYLYQEPVAGLLNRYKHKGKLACGHWLAHGLATAVAEHYRNRQITLPDAIVPVPLHWRRLQTRGFNQALEISKVLARQLGLPLHNSLRRQQHTASQQGQNRAQRQHNLEGAFALARPLPCRRIALVDDVLTTGSTATAITALLQQAGVEEVHVWAIARTP